MLRYDALIFAMILLLGFLSSGARSATVSQHNEPHAGIQAAIDRLDAQGCTRYQVTRSGQYNLSDSSDATTYSLTGNTITIKCTRYTQPPAPPSVIHDLTWSRPTTRTDGTTLPADQISGYMLEIDGQMTFIGNVLRYEATYSVALPHVYRVATVDILGRQGPWSDEVRL